MGETFVSAGGFLGGAGAEGGFAEAKEPGSEVWEAGSQSAEGFEGAGLIAQFAVGQREIHLSEGMVGAEADDVREAEAGFGPEGVGDVDHAEGGLAHGIGGRGLDSLDVVGDIGAELGIEPCEVGGDGHAGGLFGGGAFAELEQDGQEGDGEEHPDQGRAERGSAFVREP